MRKKAGLTDMPPELAFALLASAVATPVGAMLAPEGKRVKGALWAGVPAFIAGGAMGNIARRNMQRKILETYNNTLNTVKNISKEVVEPIINNYNVDGTLKDGSSSTPSNNGGLFDMQSHFRNGGIFDTKLNVENL